MCLITTVKNTRKGNISVSTTDSLREDRSSHVKAIVAKESVFEMGAATSELQGNPSCTGVTLRPSICRARRIQWRTRLFSRPPTYNHESAVKNQTVSTTNTLSLALDDDNQQLPTTPGSVSHAAPASDLDPADYTSFFGNKRKRVATFLAAVTTGTSISSSTAGAAVTVDEDEDATADTTSSDTRSACDQFSTPERVTLYHRIMSEQFTVGQRVRVQYGTNACELWFPAVIGRHNPDGTYQIIYQDLDESDATASNKSHPSVSKLIATATATAITTTTYTTTTTMTTMTMTMLAA
jgi:hypothetical protein